MIIANTISVLSIPSILIQRRTRPAGAMAWILAIFALPFIGVMLWWGVGFNYLGRKRRWRKRAAREVRNELVHVRDRLGIPDRAQIPDALAAPDYGVFPPTIGNRAELLIDGEEAFPAMIRAIDEAKHHVHFLFYIWRLDTWGHRFRDALTNAAKRGVAVRIIYDSLGSSRVSRHFLEPVRKAGARCEAFLPNKVLRGRWSINFRNHRKILLVDGAEAFIGGMNIGDEYASDGWRDFMARLRGPVVDQIQEVFVDDWYFATRGESIAAEALFGSPVDDSGPAMCNVVASGPDTESQETLDAFFIALNSARRRVALMTPYFVPDKTILTSLRTLSLRGVKLTLILPGKNNHRYVQWASRSYYHELLSFGAEVFEYRHSLLHGKAMLVDDDIAFVGSANLDHRSFRLNFEASVFIRDRDFAKALSRSFEETCRESDRIRADDYPEPKGLRAMSESLARLASPLL